MRDQDQYDCPECDTEGIITTTCGHCSGSGEGMADGTRCVACSSLGAINEVCEACEGTGSVCADTLITLLEGEIEQMKRDQAKEVARINRQMAERSHMMLHIKCMYLKLEDLGCHDYDRHICKDFFWSNDRLNK